MKPLLDEMFIGLKDHFTLLGWEAYTVEDAGLKGTDEGIPDGATAMPSPSTDGCSHEACMAVIIQLRQTLLMSMKEIVRESK